MRDRLVPLPVLLPLELQQHGALGTPGRLSHLGHSRNCVVQLLQTSQIPNLAATPAVVTVIGRPWMLMARAKSPGKGYNSAEQQ